MVNHRNEVVSDLHLGLVNLHIPFGYVVQVPELMLGDGVIGVGKLCRSARFHFHNHQQVVFGGNDVDFEMLPFPGSLKDGVAGFDEELDSDVFASFAQLVVKSHGMKNVW